MKQVLIRQGKVVVEEVPAPTVEQDRVLVQLSHSCISAGTELSGVKSGADPLWKKALKNPEKVKKALRMAAAQGFSKTKSVIEGKMASGDPSGYSAAGVVLEVGKGIRDLSKGERVACAGAQFANHAEIIQVPRNLLVPVPKTLDFSQASTVTLGAIALQGVRRAQPTLGETFVVVGLGILGQLTAQMLRANGCRVIGMDLDKARLDLAKRLGMEASVDSGASDAIDRVFRLTDGIGADGVIITAATASHEVVAQAFRLCRKKGRVVLVGDVGLNLNRADFYSKELDFFISTSYGPGRYDERYEEKGMDYPVSYVRWTENRNMSEYLKLLVEKKVRIDSLIQEIFPVEKADLAFRALAKGKPRPLMVLLSYASLSKVKAVQKAVPNPRAQAVSGKKIRIAVVGAGGFAKGMHLPNLKALASQYHLRAVVSRTGHNAAAAAKQFGADFATTDFKEVLSDKDTDAVLIATRHHLHGAMVLEALRAGKHVLVEKPLALNEKELGEIEKFYAENQSKSVPQLLTGFNRRFSKYAAAIRDAVAKRSNPMILNYRMNAGYLTQDHWVHGGEGGGRNLGEACHIYDLFTFLTGSKIVKVEAQAIKPATGYYSADDNFTATLSFAEGSVASLTYTALGSKDYPKEQMEVFVDGQVIVLNDYRELAGSGIRVPSLKGKVPDKGQREELEAFARSLQKGGDWPIPLWQQLQASRIALSVEEFLRS